jgi:SlyX protein
MEEHLIELQTKLAFQEDAIEALTRTVTRQQSELQELRLDMAELQRQIRALTPPQAISGEEKPPPHY